MISAEQYKQIEIEAMAENIPVWGLKDFVRHRLELSEKPAAEKPKVYTNPAQNKMTAYGQKIAWEKIMAVPVKERVVKVCRCTFIELQGRAKRGFQNPEQRQDFLLDRERFFLRLKERMKTLKISKEDMISCGLSWDDVKSFAYREF